MDVNEIISSGLLELHVLGMANEQETAQVIAMSKQHPEVAAELLAIESSLEHYAQVHAIIPAMKLKERVFDGINGIRKDNSTVADAQAQGKVVSVSSFWKYVAAASIILLIGSVVLSINYYDKYQKASKELVAAHKEKSDVEQQLLAQQQSNDQMKNDMNIIQSKYSEPHTLNGLPTAPTPDAVAKIFWMKNSTGDVYIDPSNLPDAPAGMQYQFWGIVDGKPVDGGLIIITKKEDKYKIQKMKSFGRAEAFAVTLETMGGNPQPKGTMYVMGKM